MCSACSSQVFQTSVASSKCQWAPSRRITNIRLFPIDLKGLMHASSLPSKQYKALINMLQMYM